MAAFAPPVHRDKFLFSSILYADAGNDNHHPRASIAELTALLRPEAAKSKKAKASEVNEPAKDQPWHYWTSQLIHYGLAATKDKNTAKVRLLTALNEKKLQVPGWITRLEAEIKKEWEVENRRLKKAAKEGKTQVSRPTSKAPATTKAPTASTTSSVTSKRKRDEIGPSKSATPGKKMKSTTAAANTVSSSVQASPSQPSNPHNSTSADDEPWPAPQRKIIEHDAWRFFDPDHLASTRPPSAPRPCPYRVSCPDAEREWGQEFIKEFYLAFSATENEWWSRFEWGAFKGILILQRQPKRVNKAVGVPFKWRAQYLVGNEEGDGDGKIYFDSSSTIKGEFQNFFRDKPCYFRGNAIQHTPAPGSTDSSPTGTPVLDQMRAEWSQMATAMTDAPAKKARAKRS